MPWFFVGAWRIISCFIGKVFTFEKYFIARAYHRSTSTP
ncbi:hypothetical protein NC651_010355 [Populus alba x Populus x berolinensis]|nr:hypothetical protein NC651_010355 [Populus alba x Populus x berolinensis]